MKTKPLLGKALAGTMFAATMLFSSSAFAQVKIGTNPTTINAANNLEVEASGGSKVAVDKTTGKVTIADGSQGDAKVLTSNANGVATWQSPGAQDSPVLFNVTNGANQTVSTIDYINFNIKSYDKGTNFNLATDQLIIPAGGTGVYQMNCIFATLNQAFLQGVYVQLEVNGGGVYALAIGNCAPGAGIGGAGSTTIPLNAGDVVKVKIIPSVQAGQSFTFFHFTLSGSMVSR